MGTTDPSELHIVRITGERGTAVIPGAIFRPTQE
jgi:hypothetical protein